MHPPASSPPADIGLYWTDDQIIMCLDKFTKGSSLPSDVTGDIDPYQYEPSNLPAGIWYFVQITPKKESSHGFWKAKGEACKIYTNSLIIGRRTTLEFFEGQAPGQKTDWVMQEYRITRKGLEGDGKTEVSRALCRVFLCGGQSPSDETHHRNGSGNIVGEDHFHSAMTTFSNTDTTSGQGSASESQVRNRIDDTGRSPEANRVGDLPMEVLTVADIILKGDYLELDDLIDPGSRSSSSDNSSRQSLSSDECFDSLAMSRDLDDNIEYPQPNVSTSKLIATASVKSNEVLIQPACLGSRASSTANKSPLALDSAIKTGKRQKVECIRGGPSTSHGAMTLIHRYGYKEEDKADISRMKKFKKYFCFFSL